MRKMNSSLATFLIALIMGVSGVGLAGCEQDSGDKMEDAVDDMGDAAEEAGDEMEDAMN